MKTNKEEGAPAYNVNTRAAGAMIHSGSSVTGMQKYMKSLEVPPIIVRTLKKQERETGITIGKFPKNPIKTQPNWGRIYEAVLLLRNMLLI